ncbi:hypothetical protein [Anaerovibrio lipolyticus]|uniref:hypothetical protein n=1 Tax=Anaerovibrio lipolyticus TaxID=82374 RepID=UPI00068EE7FE|nr:hypothetical protein [Anaerovibrio lipolyticus]
MDKIQIAFDIDTKVCRKILGKNYNKIYKDIQTFMENQGFEHRQGSVYHSINPITRIKTNGIIKNLIKEMPYITKCIRDITQTRIGDDVSINYLFEYDGTPGKYINYYKKNNQKTL